MNPYVLFSQNPGGWNRALWNRAKKYPHTRPQARAPRYHPQARARAPRYPQARPLKCVGPSYPLNQAHSTILISTNHSIPNLKRSWHLKTGPLLSQFQWSRSRHHNNGVLCKFLGSHCEMDFYMYIQFSLLSGVNRVHSLWSRASSFWNLSIQTSPWGGNDEIPYCMPQPKTWVTWTHLTIAWSMYWS